MMVGADEEVQGQSDGIAPLLTKIRDTTDALLGHLGAAEEQLKSREEKVDTARRELEDEKAAMMARDVRMEDIIELNVGGTRFATRRSTLCSAEGSVLAAMFSGRWEGQHAKDASGAIFLDMSPWCMGQLIDYLRRRQLAGPEASVERPHIPSDKAADWRLFVQYFGLQGTVCKEWRPCLDVLSPGVTSSEGGACVETTTSGHKYAFSSAPLSESCVWCAEVHGIGHYWVLLGIIGRVQGVSQPSFNDNTSYGWGGSSQVYRASSTIPEPGWTGFCSGDVVVFLLDLEGSRLQMAHKRLNKVFSLSLPREQKIWHLHVKLHEAGTKVTLHSLQSYDLTSPIYAWATTLGLGN